MTADQVVANQIRSLRKRRGISQQRLADQLGVPQSTIARIESGSRSITVSDVLRFAWALDVAPVHLLAASFQPEDVPIQNTLRLAPSDMRAWIRGEEPIPGGDHRSYFDNISDEEWEARQNLWRSEKQLWKSAGVTPSRDRLVESLTKLHEEREQNFETGMWREEGRPAMPLSEEGRRRKGQLDANRRARKSAQADAEGSHG